MILIPGKSIKVNWCLNIITKKERRQEIKNNFLENGSFYIFKSNEFLKKKIDFLVK